MVRQFFNLVVRRIPVGRRIVGGFLVTLTLGLAIASIILYNLNSLVTHTQEFTSVDAKIERLFLLASRRVTTSQLNLNRYNQGLVSEPYQARDDVVLALVYLKDARSTTTDSEQADEITLIIQSLEQYQRKIDILQATHTTGTAADVARQEADLAELSNDISVRLEAMASDNARKVAAAAADVLTEAQQYSRAGLALLGFGFLLAILLAALISYTVTQPLAELRAGTQAFQQGNRQAPIPEVGNDEFTSFARSFNDLERQIVESISNLEKRVAERTEDISRKSTQLQAAAQVARQAAAIRDPTTLVNDVVKLISEQFGFYHAGLFLIDEHNEYAVLQAASSLGGQRMMARGHRLRVGSQGIVGFAAAQKRPHIALDTGADAAFFDNPELPKTRSEAALPFIAHDRVIGVLDIQSEKPNAFTKEDIEIFQTLADQLALAFENARLISEMEVSVLQMEQASASRVLQDWTESGVTVFPAVQYTPLGIQNIPRTASESPDPQTLAIPILLRNQKIGLIKIKRKLDNNIWSKRDHDILNEISTQVGLALENARLLSEAQRRAVHERVIGDVTSRIGAATDVDTVLRTAAQEIGKALGDAEVSIQLHMEGKG